MDEILDELGDGIGQEAGAGAVDDDDDGEEKEKLPGALEDEDDELGDEVI